GLICPVGEVVTLGALPLGPGMATTRGLGLPAVLYRVLTLAPESETQNGPAGPSEIPVGWIRLGSVFAAAPATLATRLACRKSFPVTMAAAAINIRSSRDSRVGRTEMPRRSLLVSMCLSRLDNNRTLGVLVIRNGRGGALAFLGGTCGV